MADTRTEKTVAEELREAAAKLRKVAAEAHDGPWQLDQHGDGVYFGDPDSPDIPFVAEANHGDAAWITLASPALAEPLAALLDHYAAMYERMGETFGDSPSGPAERLAEGRPKLHVDFALAVARALNGSAP